MKKSLLLSAAFMALAAYDASAIKIIAGPYLQNVTPEEATVMWVTDVPALSWVETAPDDGLHFYATDRPKHYATVMGRADISRLHKVRVKGLTPGAAIRYRVVSTEVLDEQPYFVSYGDHVSTDVYRKKPLRFRTPAPEDDAARFLVLNDIHEDSVRMAQLMAPFKPGHHDFVVFNGDMVNFMNSEEQFLRCLQKATFASETPFYMARGNHESRGNFAKRYMDFFDTPTGQPYYTFRRGPVMFVVLDGGEDKPDDDIEYYGTCFSDDYRREQAEWLKKVVASEEYRSAPFHVVITHVPPVGDTWHGPLHAKELFLPILNKAEVDLMICGHLHQYVYNKPGTDGAAFPVLINSNKEALEVEATPENIKVRVYGVDGADTHNYNYPRRS